MVTIDSNVNVGFGDVTPDAHFELSANGTTGGNVMLISSDDANDGDLLTLTEAGNLGLGDSTPSYKLDVNGTGRFTGLATFDSGISVNSETITDFTGNGLSLSGGALTVATSTIHWLEIQVEMQLRLLVCL